MPVPISGGHGASTGNGAGGLEQEVNRLRREVDQLRRQSGGEPGGASTLLAWITPIMSAIALLLGIIAILRH